MWQDPQLVDWSTDSVLSKKSAFPKANPAAVTGFLVRLYTGSGKFTGFSNPLKKSMTSFEQDIAVNRQNSVMVSRLVISLKLALKPPKSFIFTKINLP